MRTARSWDCRNAMNEVHHRETVSQQTGAGAQPRAGRAVVPARPAGRGPALSQEKTLGAERPRLILPGLIPADPGLERYRVHPGAVTAVELDAGDEIIVIDAEGRQRGELTVLARGAEDYRALGTSADGAATVLRALAGAPEVVGELSERGLDPAAARAVALFGEWSPAGASACFAADQPVTAIVAAPGEPMPVDQHNPPSDLLIEIRRMRPREPGEPRLPPPP